MTLIVFLRGINVGGHRRFRPSVLAKELGAYDVVNVGAAGTLVVRQPGPRAKFLAELRSRLPVDTVVAYCTASDLLRFERENPFGAKSSKPEPARPVVVQFVSVLSRTCRKQVCFPIAIPQSGDWFVRIMGSNDRLVYGHYRRHMKSIGHLGQIDKLFGAPATTRSWSTICSVLKILKADARATSSSQQIDPRGSRKPGNERSLRSRRL